MSLAARLGDVHACPMLNPDESPHVGGPISTGAATVMIGFMPAARVSDSAVCVGPPDAIAAGSPTVLVCGMAQARVGDATVHGGVIVAGCPTVLVGDAGAGGFGGANTPSGAAAAQAKESRAAMWRRKVSEETGIPEKALTVDVAPDGGIGTLTIDANTLDGPLSVKSLASVEADAIAVKGPVRVSPMKARDRVKDN